MTAENKNPVVEEVMSGQAVLLDVRRDDEWEAGHGKPAIHFNSARILDGGELPNISKQTKIYTYCQGGGRAGRVNTKLTEQGFTDVHNLGGLSHWQEIGGEVSFE